MSRVPRVVVDLPLSAVMMGVPTMLRVLMLDVVDASMFVMVVSRVGVVGHASMLVLMVVMKSRVLVRLVHLRRTVEPERCVLQSGHDGADDAFHGRPDAGVEARQGLLRARGDRRCHDRCRANPGCGVRGLRTGLANRNLDDLADKHGGRRVATCLNPVVCGIMLST